MGLKITASTSTSSLILYGTTQPSIYICPNTDIYVKDIELQEAGSLNLDIWILDSLEQIRNELFNMKFNVTVIIDEFDLFSSKNNSDVLFTFAFLCQLSQTNEIVIKTDSQYAKIYSFNEFI